MKKSIALLSVLAFVFVLSTPVYAGHEGGQCAAGKHDCSGDSGCGESGGCPIAAKFMKKAGFMLENKEALALSDEQVKTVKALKLEVEKASLRQSADMQIFMLDVMAKLQEEPIDLESTNALIDTGSAGMAASAKSSVAAYAKLKGVLTAEQVVKAKELWSKKS